MKIDRDNSFDNKNQEGSALLLVLLVTTVLLIIGTVSLNISAKTREASDLEEKKTQALYIAESGIYKNIGEIKAAILTYLEEKAENSTATFNAYKINNASLNGGTYNLTVTLANAAANEFVAESVAYIKVSDGSDVKKTITMKFIPQDEDGEDVPSEPEVPSGGGGGGTPQIADVFKYGLYSGSHVNLTGVVIVDGTDVYAANDVKLTNASRINGHLFSKGKVELYGTSFIAKNAYVGGLCIVNGSTINGEAYVNELDMDGSGTIKGNAYVATSADINGSTLEKDAYAKNYWFWSGAKINGTAYYSQSLNVNSTTVSKKQLVADSQILSHTFTIPNLDLPVVNYDTERAAITQAAQARTVNGDLSQWESTVNQSNCIINGNVSAGGAKITLNNCIIKKDVSIYNSQLKISNCSIEGKFNMGGASDKNIVLEIDGLVWVKGSVDLNNYVTIKGNGIIVAEGNIVFGGNVDAYNNGQTNLAMISLSNWSSLAIEVKNYAKLQGLFYAPNGHIKFSNEVKLYGSVVGKNVELQGGGTGTIVSYKNLSDFPLKLPGSGSGGSVGGESYTPNIAGVKVTDWKEH